MTEQVPSPLQPTPAIRRLRNAQLRLAAIALLTMMLATVADVFLRYVFNRPLRISYDLVESLLLIYVFHGISSVFLGRRNIVIDVIDQLVSPMIVRGLAVLGDLTSVLCLVLVLWGMWEPATQAYQYGDRKLELGLPLYWLWALALAGLLGTLACAIAAFIQITLHRPGRQR